MRAGFLAAVRGGFPRNLENGQGRQLAVMGFCISKVKIQPGEVLRRFSLSDLTRGRYFFRGPVGQCLPRLFVSL
jgi:hypothetical protein